MSIAYEAVNENPRVFVAYGSTPAKAARSMARVLKDNDIRWWSASHVGEIDGEFYINIYV